jgi:hypothetical protein
MTLIVFGLSFQEEAAQLPSHAALTLGESEAAAALAPMTTIFRTAFRAMFSSKRVFRTTKKTVRFAGLSVKVRACHAYRAATADINGRSTPDYLLVTVLELSPGISDADGATAWRAFRSLEGKIDLLGKCGLGAVAAAYASAPGKTVGQNSFVLPDDLNPNPQTLADVFVFYFLAWLICLRIERSQLRADLTVARNALRMSGRKIANQRLRIINLSRYFLTQDRTNDVTLKRICAALTDKFKLRTRYDRALSLHRDFEHHLDNLSRIAQSEQMGSVSNLLLILTLASVPLSFFAAAIAIDTKSEVFTDASALVRDHRIYLLLLIGLAGSLLPFAFLKLRDMIRSRR